MSELEQLAEVGELIIIDRSDSVRTGTGEARRRQLHHVGFFSSVERKRNRRDDAIKQTQFTGSVVTELKFGWLLAEPLQLMLADAAGRSAVAAILNWLLLTLV